jgi:hypothetical protein
MLARALGFSSGEFADYQATLIEQTLALYVSEAHTFS